MISNRRQILAIVGIGFLMILTHPSRGADIGSAAAPLQVSHWIKGEAVDLQAGRGQKVYVIEFWATWCPPCRASIPHLSELQKKFKENVIFVGVTDEKPEVVEPFVKKMGEKMDYTVAVDDNAKTAKGYMDAFKIEGIPHAFIVNKDGKIIWHGHPLDDLEETLEKVVAGTYDLKAAKNAAVDKKDAAIRASNAQEKLIPKYFSLVQSGKKDAAAELGRRIVLDAGKDSNLLNEFAWHILTEIEPGMRDPAIALAAAKKAVEASGGKEWSVLDTYARALFESGQAAEAAENQKKALELFDADRKKRMEEIQQTMLDQRQNLEVSLKKYEGKTDSAK
ncbi:TlpA family protein disulfide reductase [Candidatus Sumerlaeota bacterium]|nr:TlpA family protein disulfide reductase [Candidatus Sumerlaeota bacterium]